MIMAIGTPIIRGNGAFPINALAQFSPQTTLQAGSKAILIFTNSGNPNKNVISVTDTKNNIWTIDLAGPALNANDTTAFVSSNIATSITPSDTILVTSSAPTFNTGFFMLLEIPSGSIQRDSAFDISATGVGSSTQIVSPITTSSLSTGAEIAFLRTGWDASNSLVSQAPNWTSLTPTISGSTASFYAYQITNSTAPLVYSGTTYGGSPHSQNTIIGTYKSATRLPIVGSDTNNWGQLLNDYLSVPRNSDSSLKSSVLDFQYYTTSGTWTKPQSADFVRVVCVGSGGGGGGGNTGASQSGASGGGGGAVTITDLRAADLTSIVTVTVGPGGAGGAAGANGSDGIATTFGAYAKAGGGGGGLLGASSIQAGAGASSLNSAVNVTPGNPSSSTAISGQGATTTAGFAGNNSEWGGASGGGGNIGGIRNGGSSIFGGAGGGSGAFQGNGVGAIGGTTQSYTNGGGGAAGASNGGTGTNGTLFIGPFCGSAGGGGGSSLTQAGGNGGNGGIGSGGGGGGSSTVIAGIGGNGGPGRCIIISW